MTWLIWVGAIVGISGVVWAVYKWCPPAPYEERYCRDCQSMRPWHQKKGCSVCRTTDSVW